MPETVFKPFYLPFTGLPVPYFKEFNIPTGTTYTRHCLWQNAGQGTDFPAGGTGNSICCCGLMAVDKACNLTFFYSKLQPPGLSKTQLFDFAYYRCEGFAFQCFFNSP
ncbi:hypothetical protein D3C86_1926300 [compost metagenome]